MSDLLGGIELVWPGGTFKFKILDEVDSRLGRLFYLSSADGGDVTVVQVCDWVWGRLSRGPSCLPRLRALSSGVGGAFGVDVCTRVSW